MIGKNLWHHRLLSTTAIGMSLVTAYSIFNPQVGNRPVADFVFPQKVPLASWEYIGNQAIDVNNSNAKKDRTEEIIQSASRYQYQDGNTQLDIEMQYVTDTRGNIESVLPEESKIDSKFLKDRAIKEKEGNYYSIFSDRDRTYLSSCINPMGDSTVDHLQLSTSLDRQKLDLKFLGNWLRGKNSLRDRRCLWVTISTPNSSSSVAENSALLKEVWQNWSQWWKPRFPDL